MRHTSLATALLLTLVLGACGDATSLSTTATSMTLKAAGIQTLSPLPSSGCSGSTIPPEKVVELLNALPEEHRLPVAKVLHISSPAWTMQVYSGDLGLGLCLPVQDTLLLMPEPKEPVPATPASGPAPVSDA